MLVLLCIHLTLLPLLRFTSVRAMLAQLTHRFYSEDTVWDSGSVPVETWARWDVAAVRTRQWETHSWGGGDSWRWGTSPTQCATIIKLQPKATFSHGSAEVISAAHCEAGLCYRRMVKFILYAFGCRFTVRCFIFGVTSVLIGGCLSSAGEHTEYTEVPLSDLDITAPDSLTLSPHHGEFASSVDHWTDGKHSHHEPTCS